METILGIFSHKIPNPDLFDSFFFSRHRKRTHTRKSFAIHWNFFATIMMASLNVSAVPTTHDGVIKPLHTHRRAHAFTPFNDLHMFRVIFKIHYMKTTAGERDRDKKTRRRLNE